MACGTVGPWQLASLAAAWLIGTALQLQRGEAAPSAEAAGVLLCGALSIGLAAALGVPGDRPARCAWPIRGLLLAGVAMVAFGLTDWRAGMRLAEELPAELEGRDLTLTGTVVGLPRLGGWGTQFEFDVESARLGDRDVRVPARVSLAWSAGWDGEVLLAAAARPLVAGDRWQLPVRLKRPHGLRNPHGFDLELWLFERGLRATGSVRPGGRWLGSAASRPLDRLRQRLRDAVLQRVDQPQAAGVLAALAVGDQAAIDRDDWEVFRVTGVAHLMSISGLHVTMFAWLAAAVAARLWRRLPRAVLAWPAPDAARWCGLGLAFGYALLAGWGVPAQRTVLMIAVVTGLRSLGWRWPWPLVWLSSGTAVVALDPWALLQPGFWLSFVAVGLLMASDPARAQGGTAGWRGIAADGLRTQAVATVGLAPLTLVFFQQVSVVGALANLIAVPWVTLVVTPLALAGALVPPLWQLGAWAVEALMAVLAAGAGLPWAQWTARAAPAWAIAAGVLGGILLVLPVPWRLRGLGLPLILPLLAPSPSWPAPGEVEIVAADVGQGTAVLVRTRQHLLLYDAGPRYSPVSDAAGRVLLPLLRARGEHQVDRLVLSHRDADHTGGAQGLLQGVRVQASLSSLEDGHPLLARLPGHERCEAGQHWVWDEVRFEVLHPLRADYGRGLQPNGLSCVIRISDRHGPLLLLTGDIGLEQEQELVARSGPRALAARVLLLPHHGSRSSSGEALLQAVGPERAIAQLAYRNRFGHPAPEVVERLRRLGITLVRSDACGAWHGRSGTLGPKPATGVAAAADPGLAPPGAEPHCERERRRRYWHHPGLR